MQQQFHITAIKPVCSSRTSLFSHSASLIAPAIKRSSLARKGKGFASDTKILKIDGFCDFQLSLSLRGGLEGWMFLFVLFFASKKMDNTGRATPC
jgi:hypothetical protein